MSQVAGYASKKCSPDVAELFNPIRILPAIKREYMNNVSFGIWGGANMENTRERQYANQFLSKHRP